MICYHCQEPVQTFKWHLHVSCITLIKLVVLTCANLVAGVIYLKNMVTQFWEEREAANVTDPIPFSLHEQDKQTIRDHLVDAVIVAPDPIR